MRRWELDEISETFTRLKLSVTSGVKVRTPGESLPTFTFGDFYLNVVNGVTGGIERRQGEIHVSLGRIGNIENRKLVRATL